MLCVIHEEAKEEEKKKINRGTIARRVVLTSSSKCVLYVWELYN